MQVQKQNNIVFIPNTSTPTDMYRETLEYSLQNSLILIKHTQLIYLVSLVIL